MNRATENLIRFDLDDAIELLIAERNSLNLIQSKAALVKAIELLIAERNEITHNPAKLVIDRYTDKATLVTND